MNLEQKKLLKRYNNYLIAKAFSIIKLPMAFLAGLKILKIDEEICQVSTKLNFLTKNPFRSIYFAVLSMAAELSTGLYGILFVTGIHPSIALIITGLKAKFLKKATGVITFTCLDGEKLREAVTKAQGTSQAVVVTVKSIGKNQFGETVAEFEFEWSFKQRKD
ncbi:MAG: thioesterase [Candidatus Marinimicrobia bacterium]|nr:thioesterase [Candidatus Neomarinimicrobiota bacterium]